MKIEIRQEKPSDYDVVFKTIEKAFKSEKYSDGTEQFLVERLRKSVAFIPELSIVAEANNKIVGHILLTKLKIRNTKNVFDSLALAPVSVLPLHQGNGIGTKLILQAHSKAAEIGYQSIMVLGHEDYYPKFGYQQADTFGIEFPFDAPQKNCMAIELVKNGLHNVSGLVEYPKEFNS